MNYQNDSNSCDAKKKKVVPVTFSVTDSEVGHGIPLPSDSNVLGQIEFTTTRLPTASVTLRVKTALDDPQVVPEVLDEVVEGGAIRVVNPCKAVLDILWIVVSLGVFMLLVSIVIVGISKMNIVVTWDQKRAAALCQHCQLNLRHRIVYCVQSLTDLDYYGILVLQV